MFATATFFIILFSCATLMVCDQTCFSQIGYVVVLGQQPIQELWKILPVFFAIRGSFAFCYSALSLRQRNPSYLGRSSTMKCLLSTINAWILRTSLSSSQQYLRSVENVLGSWFLFQSRARPLVLVVCFLGRFAPFTRCCFADDVADVTFYTRFKWLSEPFKRLFSVGSIAGVLHDRQPCK